MPTIGSAPPSSPRKTLTLKSEAPTSRARAAQPVAATRPAKPAPKSGARWSDDEKRHLQAFMRR
jgi:hypothetical protein